MNWMMLAILKSYLRGGDVCDGDAEATENTNECPEIRSKVAEMRKVKLENQKELRKTMSRVKSGHCSSEEEGSAQ